MKRYLGIFLAFIMFPLISFAQISGRVLEAGTNDPLPGANIIIKGTQTGTSAGPEGKFTIDAQEGDILVVSFVGFKKQEVEAEPNMIIHLQPNQETLGEITVSTKTVDIARVRETPVAVSTIGPSEISQKIGNKEFPEIMNKTPSAYATKQSGGYGDSRVSLRGFSQRNTSFLINGQPVNDMENGWVYWSNWQGLTDVASGIQIQRGLGATNLAVPSVGGTVSIFTKTTENERGGSVSQLIGNDGYIKSTASYNTGLGENGWSASFLLSHWQGNGYVNNTSGEGWTYFAAIGYKPTDNQSFNLSILGAGQWHHQRRSYVSIRDYQYFGADGIDRRWNTDGGMLNGKHFNMYRNFYNKPLATLNWDWDISDNVTLATSLYGSAGRGGGTGPIGSYYRNSDINLYPYNTDLYHSYVEQGNGKAARYSDGTINFDKVVQINRSTTSGYTGSGPYNGKLIGSNHYYQNNVNTAVLLRRASMNSHDWFGAISKLKADVDNFTFSLGIDLRKYTGYHYRKLTDLMGLDGYFASGNQNSLGNIQVSGNTIDPSPFRDTGLNSPKIDYYDIGYVNWQGVNGMIEYDGGDQFSAVIQGGVSNESFQREDFFDQPNHTLSKKKNILGGYVKGGVNYNINDHHNIFANAGLISRQPLFDAVFPNFANDINPNLQNEVITSLELGYGYTSYAVDVSLNLYHTIWGNRFITASFPIGPNASGTAQFDNVNETHDGVELETTVRALPKLKLNGMLSLGNWRYTSNFNASLFDDQQNKVGTATLYMKDVKVGNAPQFTAYLGATYRFGDLSVDAGYRHVGELYADYSPTDSEFKQQDNKGALQLPSYGLVNLGSTYRFDLFGNTASLRLNINNLFDTTYISESNTNYHATANSETWNGVDTRNFVWFGFGRTWNVSLKYHF